MKLGDEPSNWIGLALLLIVIAVLAITIHWIGLAK